MSLALFGSTGRVDFIHAHTQDKLTSRIDLLADKLRSQYSRCVRASCSHSIVICRNYLLARLLCYVQRVLFLVMSMYVCVSHSVSSPVVYTQ